MHKRRWMSWIGCLVIATLATGCGKTTAPAGPRDGGADAAVVLGLTCAKLLTCDQACNSDACTNGCYADATGVAQGLFDGLTNCISAACPSTDGGACASPNSAACSACNTQAATGACISYLASCEADTDKAPADPDGGGVVVPHADAGAELNCGEYIACVAACPAGDGTCTSNCNNQATAEARALAGVLNGCLATACPSTDGGVCATPGPTCSGCVEQAELTDTDACGPPFNTCQADRSNSPDGGSTPTVLVDGGVLSTVATGIGSPGVLVVHDGNLYYTQVVTNSQVTRLSLADGGTATVGPPLPTPVGLAVDSNNAYVWSVGTFSGSSSLNNHDGTVVQIPLNGGAAITLAQDLEVEYDAPYLNSLAVDSKNVYWVEGANGDDGAIMWAPIGSKNAAAPLFTHQYLPEAIATDGTNVYWANWGTFDAQGHSNNDGTISQGAVTGGTPMVLASNLSAPASIAIDSKNIYWTNIGQLVGDNLPAPNTGAVMQVPIGGGKVVPLASAQPIPIGIAVAGATVYWTQYVLSGPGLIMSVPVGGGTVVPLVAGLPGPFSMTISGNTVYWSNSPSAIGHGTIFSLSPF